MATQKAAGLDLRMDPHRWERIGEAQVTGIGVLVRSPDGSSRTTVDIGVLDKRSLLALLRSHGGDNALAENTVGVLLGHGHLREGAAAAGDGDLPRALERVLAGSGAASDAELADLAAVIDTTQGLGAETLAWHDDAAPHEASVVADADGAPQRAEARRKEILAWLRAEHPEVFEEQLHVTLGTSERAYWHHGYMMGLGDVLRASPWSADDAKVARIVELMTAAGEDVPRTAAGEADVGALARLGLEALTDQAERRARAAIAARDAGRVTDAELAGLDARTRERFLAVRELVVGHDALVLGAALHGRLVDNGKRELADKILALLTSETPSN